MNSRAKETYSIVEEVFCKGRSIQPGDQQQRTQEPGTSADEQSTYQELYSDFLAQLHCEFINTIVPEKEEQINALKTQAELREQEICRIESLSATISAELTRTKIDLVSSNAELAEERKRHNETRSRLERAQKSVEDARKELEKLNVEVETANDENTRAEYQIANEKRLVMDLKNELIKLKAAGEQQLRMSSTERAEELNSDVELAASQHHNSAIAGVVGEKAQPSSVLVEHVSTPDLADVSQFYSNNRKRHADMMTEKPAVHSRASPFSSFEANQRKAHQPPLLRPIPLRATSYMPHSENDGLNHYFNTSSLLLPVQSQLQMPSTSTYHLMPQLMRMPPT